MDEIKAHWLSAALFLFYWLIVFGLEAFGWHKPENRPEDMIPTVLYLHFLLPVMAGAMVSSWRRYKPGRITGGMLAGAAVIVVDAAAVLGHALIAFHLGEPGESGESILELPVFLIAIGLVGSLLGLIGAAVATGLGHLLDRWRKPAPARVSLLADERTAEDRRAPGSAPPGAAGAIVPPRLLLVAGGLAWAAAVIVLAGVIPGIADTVGRTAPRAVPAFAVNAILNMLIGIALLAPMVRRSARASKTLVVMGGFLSFLLSFALLDAASAIAGHRRGMLAPAVASLAGAAGDLVAGVLALVAAFRRVQPPFNAGRVRLCRGVPPTI